MILPLPSGFLRRWCENSAIGQSRMSGLLMDDRLVSCRGGQSSAARWPCCACSIPRTESPAVLGADVQERCVAFEWCNVLPLLFFHFDGISRSVILDLKFQKIVNCLDGVGILSGETDFRALSSLSNRVGDPLAEPFHCLYPGRHCFVDKHRN